MTTVFTERPTKRAQHVAHIWLACCTIQHLATRVGQTCAAICCTQQCCVEMLRAYWSGLYVNEAFEFFAAQCVVMNTTR